MKWQSINRNITQWNWTLYYSVSGNFFFVYLFKYTLCEQPVELAFYSYLFLIALCSWVARLEDLGEICVVVVLIDLLLFNLVTVLEYIINILVCFWVTCFNWHKLYCVGLFRFYPIRDMHYLAFHFCYFERSDPTFCLLPVNSQKVP